MKNWKKEKFGDIIEKIIGGGTPSKARESYWGGNIFWATVKDMKDGVFSLSSTQDRITEEGLNNSSTNLIPKNNIIISTRMGLGRCFINKTDMAINQDLKAVFPNEKIDKKFLLWLIVLKSKEIISMGSGATVMGIRLEQLHNLDVEYPIDKKDQQKIASILSAYDDLIEVNNRRIKILEEMAQFIYKEWFVDFKFPGYEKVKMVNGVPEGWGEHMLKDFVDFARGIEPGSKNYLTEHKKGAVPFLRVGDLGARSYGLYIEEEQAKGRTINRNDIVVSMDGTVGIVKTGLEGAYSTGIRKLVIRDERMNQSFLYCLMLSEYIQNIIKAHAQGATIQHASKSIDYMMFSLPPKELADEFNKIVEPIMKSKTNLEEINLNLKKTRDLLLPKLMNGEIEIKD